MKFPYRNLGQVDQISSNRASEIEIGSLRDRAGFKFPGLSSILTSHPYRLSDPPIYLLTITHLVRVSVIPHTHRDHQAQLLTFPVVTQFDIYYLRSYLVKGHKS